MNTDGQQPATAVAESSPAQEAPTFEVPTDTAAYNEWRKSGKMPEPAKKQEAPPASESSSETAAEEGTAVESAPASEAGRQQEPRRARGNAETRLNELLSDLKKAGLTPAELKSFKKAQTQQPTQTTEPVTRKAEPQPALAEPKEPVLTDYTAEKYGDAEKAWLAYDKDSRQYARELAKYEAHKGIEEYKAAEAQKAQAKALDDMISEAKTRRPDVVEIIVPTADAIFPDEQIPVVVKQMLASSKVYVDLLYVLGGDQAKLEAWIQKAKSDPGEAIREAILLESLVKAELGKGKTDAPPRDPASGRFQAENANPGKESTAPAPKKITGAPGPTAEVGGKATPPADPELSAVESGNMEAFTAARNQRDLETKKARR